MKTLAVVATGKSVTLKQMDYLHNSVCDVMVINETFLLAPWADYLFAVDKDWWAYYGDIVSRNFYGECYTSLPASSELRPYPKLFLGSNKEHSQGGLNKVPGHVYNGGCGGHAALNVAYHLGYSRIVLLGFDMKPGHWFRKWIRPAHMRKASSYEHFNNCVSQICSELEQEGVLVYNCTPNSLLGIKYTPLEEVL